LGTEVNKVSLGWSLTEITDAISGDLIGQTTRRVEAVTTDSRNDVDNDLFVALAGETFDGHAFAAAVLQRGAVGVVVEKSAGIDVTPRIEVESTQDALAMLARKRRDELAIPVVAVTGSTGKTSTKDLLEAGIEGSWASPRSFNNEIGVPLTVLATPPGATALIVEVGSRGRGHIAWLAPIVRPDVAVITNLGVVHLETFGTPSNLADAKFELVEALHDGGIAVLPYGEESLQREGEHRTITFGDRGADVVVSDVSVNDLGEPSFRIETERWSGNVSLPLAGTHQALNASAAIGVAAALDMDVEAFALRLGSATGSGWRMDVHEGVYTVVNDTYNANPQSVESALRTVAAMAGRHIAVLGVMSELGPVCEREHIRLGALTDALGFAELLVVGPDHGYAAGFKRMSRKATSFEDAADTLAGIVKPGDVVLVKASRSASLDHLALRLIEDAAS
jgi:UDP-N-acetylmuramoyl-tripeptide--D-alanyl-D-alanine ligase